jgi:hypothetical protein
VSSVEAIVAHAADGVVLEAEYAPAASGVTRGVPVVLCHPHPQYGGTMRSLLLGPLFAALPAAGHACVRFNFRGVEGSAGSYTGGDAEPLDVVAALDELLAREGGRGPAALAGWSFGADMALAVTDARVAAWVAIAAPLRFGDRLGELAVDPRPKHFVLGEHDEVRPAREVMADVVDWSNTTVEVVPGASHFFVGRTDRVVDAVVAFLASLR